MNILEKSVKYDEGPVGWKIKKGVAPNSLKNALSSGPKDNSYRKTIIFIPSRI